VWGLLNKLTGTAPFAMGKPVASVDQYAPVLRAALLALGEAPPDADELDPGDQEAVVAFVQSLSEIWEIVNARRLELEQIQPEPRLSAVHTEAVKLLRAYITVMNASNGSMVAALQGDFAKRHKLQKEADSWAPVMQSVAQKLTRALKQMQSEQPTLYGMLGLEETGFGPQAEPAGPGRG
jgi:hypothetical protein